MCMSSKLAVLLISVGVASATWAAPCKGSKRLQLRWSQRAQHALVSFAVEGCALPAACAAGGVTGSALTKPPFTMTVTDAAGKSLSGTLDPANASCGTRCGQISRGRC